MKLKIIAFKFFKHLLLPEITKENCSENVKRTYLVWKQICACIIHSILFDCVSTIELSCNYKYIHEYNIKNKTTLRFHWKLVPSAFIKIFVS